MAAQALPANIRLGLVNHGYKHSSLLRYTINYGRIFRLYLIELCHQLDGITNPKYKVLCFLTTKFFFKEKKALAFNRDKCFHLVLCLRLSLFHSINVLGSCFFLPGAGERTRDLDFSFISSHITSEF